MSAKAKAFLKTDIKAAVWKDEDGDSSLVLEHAGEWVDEGKYQYQENILRETATGKFYLYNHSKSGSYFSEFTFGFMWEPDEIELVQVIKATRIIEVWIALLETGHETA